MFGAVAVLAIAALAVPATLYFQRSAPEPVVTRLDVVTPPTSDSFSFALSSDGRQLAFVANGDRGPQLWLRPLDQVKAQLPVGTEGAAYPFWAPDGRALGFFADGNLKRIDLKSGTVQVLADAPQPRGGTWNTDGVIVFAPSVINALMRVGANGGAVRPVTRLAAGQGSHRWPQFLPDGRRFLFFVGQGQPETHGAYVGSLDGGEPTRVMPSEVAAAYATPGYLLLASQGVLSAYPDSAALWSPDGNRVVFRSTRKGTYDLFEKPTSGTADEQPILVTSQGKSPLQWSHDGRSLAEIFRLVGFRHGAQYAVAADGRFLMNVAAEDRIASPITIVQNWDAALKK